VGLADEISFYETLNSKLNKIPGVGPARVRALLAEFGSVAAVAAARPERLAQVKGFSAELARQVVEYLRNGEEDA